MQLRETNFTLPLVALLIVTAGCGSSSRNPTGPAADMLAPTVNSTNPANGATGVSVITASFSEAMDASTITTTSFTLSGRSAVPVIGTVTYDPGTEMARFTPSNALAAGVTYTATVTIGATDLVGNALATNHVWSFRTPSTVYDRPTDRRK